MCIIGLLTGCKVTTKEQQECNAVPVEVFGNPYKAVDFKIWVVSQQQVTYDMLSDKTPVLDGTNVVESHLDKNYQGNIMASFQFDKEGTDVFEKVTDENTGRYMAFTLGDSVIYVARVNNKISSGQLAVFTETEDQACALIKILMTK